MENLVFSILIYGCERDLNARQSFVPTFMEFLPHPCAWVVDGCCVHSERLAHRERLEQRQILPIELDASGERTLSEAALELEARIEGVSVVTEFDFELSLKCLCKLAMFDSPVTRNV